MSGDPFDYQLPPAKVVGKATIKLDGEEEKLTVEAKGGRVDKFNVVESIANPNPVLDVGILIETYNLLASAVRKEAQSLADSDDFFPDTVTSLTDSAMKLTDLIDRIIAVNEAMGPNYVALKGDRNNKTASLFVREEE